MNIIEKAKSKYYIRRNEENFDKFKENTDVNFLRSISPKGGLNFSHEKFVSCGDGYEACVYVYKYPKEPGMNWLNAIANIDNTITVLDIASMNELEVKKNLNKSMEEQNSRYVTAKNNSQKLDAQQIYTELETLYKEVTHYGEVMKIMCVRIYVPARDLHSCDLAVSKIIKELETLEFKAQVCVNETKQDYQNLFLPYSKQMEGIYKRRGQEMSSLTLALGNPFHFTFLEDPQGFYYGNTQTDGSVLLDIFRVTDRRMSYNSVIVGKMGSGKSTTLKKMMFDRSIRGDMVRLFDVTGEFKELCSYLGGEIVSLDGQSKNIINVLQILATGENNQSSYNSHIAKVSTIYKYLKREASSNEILILKKLLRLLYIKWGIVNENGEILKDISSLKPEEFPIWGDFLNFIREGLKGIEKRQSLEEQLDNIKEEEEGANITSIRKSKEKYVENIELVVEDLCLSYGNIFNGHTSVKNFYKEQIVCFDITNLAAMEENIFDAQLFNALSLCWDNCSQIGRNMKKLYDTKKINWEDITRFLILIDEAHRIVNANKLAGVEQITRFEREARKYFGGIVLASQSIRDFVPDDSETTAANQIKTLFELSTYKWIMNQDSNCKKKVEEIFRGEFNEGEIEEISKLSKGEVILSIAGENNLSFTVYCSDAELTLFQGGA